MTLGCCPSRSSSYSTKGNALFASSLGQARVRASPSSKAAEKHTQLASERRTQHRLSSEFSNGLLVRRGLSVPQHGRQVSESAHVQGCPLPGPKCEMQVPHLKRCALCRDGLPLATENFHGAKQSWRAAKELASPCFWAKRKLKQRDQNSAHLESGPGRKMQQTKCLTPALQTVDAVTRTNS